MSYFEDNLELLKVNNNILYKKVFEEPLYSVDLFEDQFGIKVQRNKANVYLQSIYDIDREQREIFKTMTDDMTQVVLFGLGLGDSIRYLQNNYPNLNRIVVIEPSVDLYKKFLESFSMKNDLKLTNVTLFINDTPEILAHELTILMSRVQNTNIYVSLSYRALFGDIYQEIHNRLLKTMQFLAANTQMTFVHLHLWAYNSLKNLKQPAIAVEEYFEYFNKKPIIIIGAGPSLNRELEFLKKASDKAIVIAVGSGMRVAEKHGIKPHFRMAYDGNQLEMHAFDGLDNSDIPLIFSNRLYFEVLENYSGPKIRMIIDQDTISRYLLDGMETPYQPIRSGPSITVVALDLLCRAGASEVMLLGQDLCYSSEGLTYAEGGRLEDNRIDFSNKMYYQVPNSNGDLVYTMVGFIGVRDGLGFIIDHYPEVKVYNGTQGGLEIPGAKQVLLCDWLASKPMLEVGANLNLEIRPSDQEEYNKKYFAELEVMSKDIEKIELITERRIKMIKRFMKYRQREMKPSKLDEIYNEIQKMELELMNVKLYEIEIVPNLRNVFNAIYSQNFYDGSDLKKRYESKEKIVLGCAANVEEYLLHLKNVFWEITGKIKNDAS